MSLKFKSSHLTLLFLVGFTLFFAVFGQKTIFCFFEKIRKKCKNANKNAPRDAYVYLPVSYVLYTTVLFKVLHNLSYVHTVTIYCTKCNMVLRTTLLLLLLLLLFLYYYVLHTIHRYTVTYVPVRSSK